MSYIVQNGSGTFQPIEAVSTIAQHQPGTQVYAVDLSGNWGEFVYLRANTTIAKGSNVSYDPYNWTAMAVFSPVRSSGLIAQAALIGVPAGYWAWFMLRGSNLTGPSDLSKFNGYPVASFSSINDINAGFSSGTYSMGPPTLFANTAIQLNPAASGGTQALVTVDLTGALSANSLLQKFDINKLSTIGILIKVQSPVAFDSNNGAVFMYLTAQSNRIQANWNLSGAFKIDLDRGGWFFLTLDADRNGFVETNGVVQQGFVVDGNAASNLMNSATNLVDSVRFGGLTAALNNTATQSIIVDSLWINPAAKPTLMIHFDDGYNSQYSEAALYMGSKGLRGTIGVVSNLVGTNGYMNTATLQKLYDAGWDLVNHSRTHFNAGTQSVNSITGGTGAIINAGAASLTGGSIGLNPFDAPRHITITSVANEAGRPFTIVGLGELGQPQTDVLYAKNADAAISESVWTQITSITNSSATNTAGNIQIGTSYSYNECFNDYDACKTFLQGQGWTRGSNLAIVPNGIITGLLQRALTDLSIVSARGVSNRVNYAYPGLPGYNPMNLPGYGGGGATSTAVTLTTQNDIYNSAGSGAFSATSFVPSPTIAAWAKYTRWKLVINSGATTADISDMDGNYIGTCTSGTPFTRFGITFTFTVGTSIAGDTFYINVGSNMTTLLKETIRKKGVCVAYLHNILPANAGQTSLDIYRSDFRTFIDEVANDVQKGRIACPTFSEYYKDTTR